MNSGIEHAALMVSEEKTQHDSRKNQKQNTQIKKQITKNKNKKLNKLAIISN